VLAGLDRFQRGRLVVRRRRAHVDDVNVRQHCRQAGIGGRVALARERLPPLGRRRRHAGQSRVDAVHPAVGRQMQPGREA
jgi:hypothetical protein